MDDISERIRYGFGLWPFPALIMFGIFINSFGPSLYQSALSGLGGLPLSQVILIVGVLVIQLAAGIIAGAGFFGGLHKVLEDVRE